MSIDLKTNTPPKWLLHMLLLLGAVLLVVLNCVNPSQEEEELPSAAMTLTLDGTVSTSATFTGEPILAQLLLNDTLMYGELAWHSGSAVVRNPRNLANSRLIIDPRQRIWAMSVELSWNLLPKSVGSSGERFDTIFASTGGGLKASNVVRIIVRNIPPRIDSVFVGIQKYDYFRQINPDSLLIFNVKVTDTIIPIRLRAADVDGKDLFISWKCSTPLRLESDDKYQDDKDARYSAPEGNFRDTVIVHLSDGSGGQEFLSIVMQRMLPNVAPLLDSVKIDTLMVRSFASVIPVYRQSFDSLRLTLFATDANRDVITAQASASKGEVSLLPNRLFSWLYTSEQIPVPRMAFDTLVVTVRDSALVGTTARFALIQGKPNSLPVIDSFVVNGVRYKGDGKRLTLTVDGGDTLRISGFASDADSADSLLKYSWEGRLSTQVVKVDSNAVVYWCADSLYADTLELRVSDGFGTSAITVAVAVTYRSPSIDSIRVSNVVSRDTTMFRRSASPSASLKVLDPTRLDVRAFGVVGQEPALYKWESIRGLGLGTTGPNAIYTVRDSVYTDSIRAILTDGRGAHDTMSIFIEVGP
jgi:hypothetical protein